MWTGGDDEDAIEGMEVRWREGKALDGQQALLG